MEAGCMCLERQVEFGKSHLCGFDISLYCCKFCSEQLPRCPTAAGRFSVGRRGPRTSQGPIISQLILSRPGRDREKDSLRHVQANQTYSDSQYSKAVALQDSVVELMVWTNKRNCFNEWNPGAVANTACRRERERESG